MSSYLEFCIITWCMLLVSIVGVYSIRDAVHIIKTVKNNADTVVAACVKIGCICAIATLGLAAWVGASVRLVLDILNQMT